MTAGDLLSSTRIARSAFLAVRPWRRLPCANCGRIATNWREPRPRNETGSDSRGLVFESSTPAAQRLSSAMVDFPKLRRTPTGHPNKDHTAILRTLPKLEHINNLRGTQAATPRAWNRRGSLAVAPPRQVAARLRKVAGFLLEGAGREAPETHGLAILRDRLRLQPTSGDLPVQGANRHCGRVG